MRLTTHSGERAKQHQTQTSKATTDTEQQGPTQIKNNRRTPGVPKQDHEVSTETREEEDIGLATIGLALRESL